MSFALPRLHAVAADCHFPAGEAPATVTHLGIGAHPDDLEFMALHGILASYTNPENRFGAVVITDGAGSPGAADREHLVAQRRTEQRRAAELGRYGFVVQLGYDSRAVKGGPQFHDLVEDLTALLRASDAGIVYSHQPFDRHPTHQWAFRATLAALHRLPPDQRPFRWLGGEVWRGLDWLPAGRKVRLDVSGGVGLAAQLGKVWTSQLTGGKRYDLAVDGRYRANATFDNSHASDAATHLSYAIDLTELLATNGPTTDAFVDAVLAEFAAEIGSTGRPDGKRK